MASIELIIPWVSLIVGLIAVASFATQRKKAAMDEGRRLADIGQLRKDLDRAFEKVHALEASRSCTDIDIAELKTDMKHVIAALERIENRLAGAT
jgi:uncharacterized protein YlxW (UPF0749 family)